MSRQGYQLVAAGASRYLRMAAACAASLRVWDGTRPIQLVTDRPADDLTEYSGLFDVVTPCPAAADLPGPLVKLRLHDFAAFDETMFVDADCLLLKGDIGRYWDDLSANYAVATPGDWRSAGDWYGMDIADMCRLAGIERLVQMNSGALYFRRGDIAAAFFDRAKAFVSELGDFTGHDHRGLGPPDEPYLGLAFGALGLDPYPMRDGSNNCWMIATFNSFELRLDAFSGQTALVKHARTVSPSICHFVGPWPADLYERLASDLLARATGRDSIAGRADRP